MSEKMVKIYPILALQAINVVLVELDEEEEESTSGINVQIIPNFFQVLLFLPSWDCKFPKFYSNVHSLCENIKNVCSV